MKCLLLMSTADKTIKGQQMFLQFPKHVTYVQKAVFCFMHAELWPGHICEIIHKNVNMP